MPGLMLTVSKCLHLLRRAVGQGNFSSGKTSPHALFSTSVSGCPADYGEITWRRGRPALIDSVLLSGRSFLFIIIKKVSVCVCARVRKILCEADGLCRVALKFEWAPLGYVYTTA